MLKNATTSPLESAAPFSRECTSCQKASNNKFYDCPPRMADGRLFTDYRPRCVKNFLYPPRDPGKFLDSYKYRQHLIKNADHIITDMRAKAYEKALCGPCVEPHSEAGTMLPEHTMQVCNSRSCGFYLKNPFGLGLGRNYGVYPDPEGRDAFLKAKEKERKHLLKKANCCSTPEDNLRYYPIDPALVNEKGIGRYTTPYGGKALFGGDASTVPYDVRA